MREEERLALHARIWKLQVVGAVKSGLNFSTISTSQGLIGSPELINLPLAGVSASSPPSLSSASSFGRSYGY